MSKPPLQIFILILTLILAFWWGSLEFKKDRIQTNYEVSNSLNESQKIAQQTIDYTLEGKTYKLLVADEEEERNRGLMFVRSSEDFDGALFLFEKAKIQTFWNKNTYKDLDLYWIKGEEVVGKSFLPSVEKSGKIETVHSPVPVDTVVEIIK